MRLYHGSNMMIENIDLSKCKPYKDFGRGFYLTEIKEQAEKMASRTAAIYGGEPTVTEFEFDELPSIHSRSRRLRIRIKNGLCSFWPTAAGTAGNLRTVLTS